MFTGLIEEVGKVERVATGAQSARLTIGCQTVLEGTKLGDSIAVCGVCLTVVELTSHSFTADVMAETMRRSKLGTLHTGDLVNLERALLPTTRLGGHIVSGHIDGTGRVQAFKQEDNAVWVTIGAEPFILRYVIEKGSIAIDGISLTVARVTEKDFAVSIIPHTGAETTLLKQKIGDVVNLECDLVGKYVEKLLQPIGQTKESKLTTGFLAEHGFL